MLSNKNQAIIAVALIAISFASGRYSVQAPTVKQTEVTRTDDKVKVDEKTHTNTVTVVTKKPSGEEQTTTTTTEDTYTVADTTTDTKTNETETVTPPKKSTLNLSVLAATNFDTFGVPIYGLSVSKQLLGPVTVGVFGLTNRTVGVSVGLSF